jgi:hypothetical protein
MQKINLTCYIYGSHQGYFSLSIREGSGSLRIYSFIPSYEQAEEIISFEISEMIDTEYVLPKNISVQLIEGLPPELC